MQDNRNGDQAEHIVVSVRARPLNVRELKNNERIAWFIDNQNHTITSIPTDNTPITESSLLDDTRPRTHSYAFGMCM